MSDFDSLMATVARAWRSDPIKRAAFVVPVPPEERGMSHKSVWNQLILDQARVNHPIPLCGVCGAATRAVARICTADDPYSRLSQDIGISIYTCKNDACRAALHADLGSEVARHYWATHLIPIGNGQFRSVTANWMSLVIDTDMENISAVKDNYRLEIREDRIEIDDAGWYGREGGSSQTRGPLRAIRDGAMQMRVANALASSQPHWYDAKFGGYPHWRTRTEDGGCECWIRGTLVFTFSHALSPDLCETGTTNAYLFMCREHPLQHDINVYIQKGSRSFPFTTK